MVRWEDEEQVSVLYGRCAHRGALMSDGHIKSGNLVCGVHNWDYCFKSGVSSYNSAEKLHRFNAWLENGEVWVDEEEIKAWAVDNPQPYNRDAYQGLYKDIHGAPEEPHTIHSASGRTRPVRGRSPWPGQCHGRSKGSIAQVGTDPAVNGPVTQSPPVG